MCCSKQKNDSSYTKLQIMFGSTEINKLQSSRLTDSFIHSSSDSINYFLNAFYIQRSMLGFEGAQREISHRHCIQVYNLVHR